MYLENKTEMTKFHEFLCVDIWTSHSKDEVKFESFRVSRKNRW